MNEIPPPEGKGALIIPSEWRVCTITGLSITRDLLAHIILRLNTSVSANGNVIEISRGDAGGVVINAKVFENFVRELEKASRTSQYDVRITFDETATDRLRAVCGEVSSWLKKALHLHA